MALARAMFGNRMDPSRQKRTERKFAQSVPMNLSGDMNNSQKSKKVVKLKLVILDEADSMTSAAQACLRRTMEIYSKTTRFCLICNYVSRIIEPIASRCSKFRFQSITESIMRERLEYICQNENVKYSDTKVLDHLIVVCDGDLRQAITLQSAHRLAGQSSQIDLDLIHEVSGFIPRRHINRFVAVCKSKSLERMEEYITDLINEGYTASQFLNQIHDWLLAQSSISDVGLAGILPALALAEHRFCDGSDEYIQLMYVSSVIMKHFDCGTASQ